MDKHNDLSSPTSFAKSARREIANKQEYSKQLEYLDSQFPWTSKERINQRYNYEVHHMEKTKSQHIKLNARDFNSQLVLHGTNGNSRILEAPIKYVKELQKGHTKFNNSYEAMILNKIEQGF